MMIGSLANEKKSNKVPSPSSKWSNSRKTSSSIASQLSRWFSFSPSPSKPNSTGTSIGGAGSNSSMMYGDAVIGLSWTMMVAIHGWEYRNLSPDDPVLHGARIVYPCVVAAAALAVSSWWTQNLAISRMAFAANIAAISVTNLYGFPSAGGRAITAMMLGGTVLGVLANVSLSCAEKLTRLPVCFAAGSFLCFRSPHCDYRADTLPVLGGAVLAGMVLLTFVHSGGVSVTVAIAEGYFVRIRRRNIAHVARMVLAGLFLHHLASTLYQLSAVAATRGRDGISGEHGGHIHNGGITTPMAFFALIKAAVLAAVGVAATGAFQEEINSKERAEQKAREESMMAKAMADSMVCLTHELRTPLQG